MPFIIGDSLQFIVDVKSNENQKSASGNSVTINRTCLIDITVVEDTNINILEPEPQPEPEPEMEPEIENIFIPGVIPVPWPHANNITIYNSYDSNNSYINEEINAYSNLLANKIGAGFFGSLLKDNITNSIDELNNKKNDTCNQSCINADYKGVSQICYPSNEYWCNEYSKNINELNVHSLTNNNISSFISTI